MSNENPESPIKPQVIDLDAEDVIVDNAEAPSAPLPPAASKTFISPTKWLLLAALLGGTVIGAWVYKDFLSGYLPSSELLAAQSRIDTLGAQTKTLAEQVAAISSASDQLKSQAGTFATNIQGLADKTTGVESRIATIEVASKSAKAEIEKLKSGVAVSGTAAVDGNALAVLAQRLDALEKDVASLKTAGAPTDQSTAAAALSQSLADLKAKIAAGASYRDELDWIYLAVMPWKACPRHRALPRSSPTLFLSCPNRKST